MRVAETVFLLHQAEEESSAEKYVCAFKFAAPLFATNHAIKYVSICDHFASDVDKKIFESIILTKETANGKPIFADRFAEWMVRDIRASLGKHYRRGTDGKLELEQVLMQQKKKIKAALARRASSTADPSEFPVASAFCTSLVYCVETCKLWRVNDSNCLVMEPGEMPLNQEMIIDWPLTGVSRINSYIKHEFVYNEEDKPKAAPLMTQIQPTVEKRDTTNKILLSGGYQQMIGLWRRLIYLMN
jgi:hypothetical protein